VKRENVTALRNLRSFLLNNENWLFFFCRFWNVWQLTIVPGH
jgi:hypothetical protein